MSNNNSNSESNYSNNTNTNSNYPTSSSFLTNTGHILILKIKYLVTLPQGKINFSITPALVISLTVIIISDLTTTTALINALCYIQLNCWLKWITDKVLYTKIVMEWRTYSLGM